MMPAERRVDAEPAGANQVAVAVEEAVVGK
jgi:hypothetical protein